MGGEIMKVEYKIDKTDNDTFFVKFYCNSNWKDTICLIEGKTASNKLCYDVYTTHNEYIVVDNLVIDNFTNMHDYLEMWKEAFYMDWTRKNSMSALDLVMLWRYGDED